jgi:hypothetical protein
MNRQKFQVILVALLSILCSVAMAREIYVSPTGTANGNGGKNQPLDVFTALGAKSPAQPGDTIILLGGRYDGKMDGNKRVPFELAVSGADGNPIRIRPMAGQAAHLNGTVTLTSSYAEYSNLEIGDLQWDPWQKAHQNETALNAMKGTNAKIINCNIFGGTMGTGAWSPAVGLEIYGCLIHDFGYLVEEGRGHGHAFYAQNETGTKTFANNIAYRGCGWNVHVYTQSGQIRGFDILDNICYIAGSYKGGQTMDNYLISGYPPADRIRLIGNVGYQPSNVDKWRSNARLSNYKGTTNGSGELRDNYLVGAPIGLLVAPWQQLQITGNTFWAYNTLVDMGAIPAEAIGKAYKVDSNTYIANGQPAPFKIASKSVDFAGWQALGLDANGHMATGKDGKPAGTKTFVFANKYQKGRANIGVFNWDGQDSAAVDLSSVLGKGQKYCVYNCLDIKQTLAQAKPVMKSTYNGKSVELPLRKDPISPEFDAFLIVPQE